MPITARVQLTPEDQLAALRLGLTSNVKSLILPIFIFFCCAGGFCYHIARVIQGHPPESGLWFTGIILILLVWVVFFETPRKVRKSFAEQKSLHAPFEVGFGETHFTSTSPHGMFTMPWGEFHKWQQGRELLVLYQSATLCHIIPRRAFASDEDFQNAIAILKTKASKPQ